MNIGDAAFGAYLSSTWTGGQGLAEGRGEGQGLAEGRGEASAEGWTQGWVYGTEGVRNGRVRFPPFWNMDTSLIKDFRSVRRNSSSSGWNGTTREPYELRPAEYRFVPATYC